jgi:hypothetical protein
MYANDIVVRDNQILRAWGAAGMGIVHEARHVSGVVLQRLVNHPVAKPARCNHPQAPMLVEFQVYVPRHARPVRDFVGNLPSLMADRFCLWPALMHAPPAYSNLTRMVPMTL